MAGRLSHLDKIMLSLLAALIVVPAGLGTVFYLMIAGRGRVAEATSPDGVYRIVLHERTGGAFAIDRNFDLLLWDRSSASERKIGWPLCHDQSPSITREHVVWSADSRYVALVGDRYFVSEEAKLPSGDLVLLAYNTRDDIFYSNYDFEEAYEPFPATRAVVLFGEAILQPAPPIE